MDTTGTPVQIGQAGQKTGHFDGVTVNIVSRWMIMIALENAVQTLSEADNVKLNVLDPATTTRFFVLMIPILSIENSSIIKWKEKQ